MYTDDKGGDKMKKLTKYLLVCLMGLSIVGCSGKKDQLSIEWEKENKFADIVSLQIESISKTRQVEPDVIGSFYTYYKPDKATDVLLDVTMQMKNLKKEDLKLSNELQGSLKIDGKSYVVRFGAVSENGKTISNGGTIGVDEMKKVHCYTEIDTALMSKEMTFELKTKDEDNEQTAALSFQFDDVNSHYKTKNLKETITFDGAGEVTFESVKEAKKLEPSKPTGIYTYFKVKNENKSFVIIPAKIKNTTDVEIPASNIATVTLIDANHLEYRASVVYEYDNKENLTQASSINLKPGQSATVYYKIEASEEVAKGEKSLRVDHGGQVYLIKL